MSDHGTVGSIIGMLATNKKWGTERNGALNGLKINICSKYSSFLFIFCFLKADDWEVPFEDIRNLQWLGSGAQGAVFLGTLKNTEIAVKKVRDEKETDIKHLRKLNHPNIVGIK